LTLWYASTIAVVAGGSALWSLHLLRRVLEDRTDHFLEETRRGFLSVLATEESEYADRDQAIQAAVAEIGFTDTRLLVVDSTGAVAGRSAARGLSEWIGDEAEWEVALAMEIADLRQERTVAPLPLAAAVRAGVQRSTVGDGAGFRIASGAILLHGTPYDVVAARSLADVVGTLDQVRRAYLIAVPLVLIVSAFGGYLLARRALSPVSTMARRASAMGAVTLHERLPIANPSDELGELATAFNGLLSRLEQAFGQQRRFLADASHELRTPVAVLLAESEVALSRPCRTDAEYRDALQVMRNSTVHLSHIVEDLFVLARSDNGQLPLRRENLYLDEIADDCARAMQSVAAARQVHVVSAHVLPTDTGAPMRGDPALLERLLYNLIDNAIKHSPPSGTVSVTVRDTGADWTVTVSDQGPGIAPELHTVIFERFVRGPSAQSTVAGAGLGLAIARWVAEHHGGTLVLTHTGTTGSEFTARLPKTDQNGPAAAATSLT
jgi:heavy metal sensor kinase